MTRSRISKEILEQGQRFIESVAASPEAKQTYGRLPERMRGRVGNAILFGILTANERYEASERAMPIATYYLRAPYDLDAFKSLKDGLREAGIMLYNDKASAIHAFAIQWNNNPTPFHPLLEETCAEYRDRLLTMNIRGLGFVKTSFAAYLAYGGGNVICPDRHIINVYTNGEFRDAYHKDTKAARAFLKEIEDYFVKLADKYQWPSASALQWAVWCEAIGQFTDHEAAL